jgi:hypothetical protein
MKFTTTLATLLTASSVALALPITNTAAKAELPQTPNTIADTTSIAERDSQWPWERPLRIIGEYPDGTKKCLIMARSKSDWHT